MARWSLDTTEAGKRPKYARLASSIRNAIESGTLVPGERLPPHRKLAYQLGISVRSVARAYQLLGEEGWLSSHVGRGTVVTLPVPGKSIALARDSGVTDLSYVLPPVLTDVDVAAEGAALLREMADGWSALALGDILPEAGEPHHTAAAEYWLRQQGVPVAPGCVHLTVGTQEALMSILSALCHRRKTVLVEPLTIVALKNLATHMGVQLQMVESDAEGVLPESLLALARAKAADVAVLQPGLQCPTARRMGIDRRHAVVEAAREAGLILVDYDGWGSILETDLPPLAALAPERVVHVNGFSNALIPGVRAGFLSVPAEHSDAVAAARHAHVLSTPRFVAEFAARLVQSGCAMRLATAIQRENTSRMDVAREVLGDRLAGTPADSPFCWLRPRAGLTGAEMAQEARRAGVQVLDSDHFRVSSLDGQDGVRIALSAARTHEALYEALTALRPLAAD